MPRGASDRVDRLPTARETPVVDGSDTKICPDCAEEVRVQARVCRYCGFRFEGGAGTAEQVDTLPSAPPGPVAASVSDVASPLRRTKRRWPRDLGYAGAVLLWVVAAIPLGGRLVDPPRDGAEIAASFVVALALPLGVAAAVRLAYAKLRKRRFASPWLFVFAAVIAFLIYAGQVLQEQDRVNKEAVERGVVERAEDATPVDRCVTLVLEEVDTLPYEQRALILEDGREFLTRVCAAADREGNLTTSGHVYATDEFRLAMCTEVVLAEFDEIPPAERAFTRADFAVFGRAYCEEAVEQGIGRNTPRSEIEALQGAVLDRLLESGQIKRIR